MSKAFELMDGATLIKLIGDSSKRQQSVDKMTQLAAVHAAVHANTTGDIRYVNSLYESLSKSNRKSCMVTWLEKHAAVAYGEKDKKFSHFKQDGRTYELDGNKLFGVLWFESKGEEKVVSSIDVQEMMDKMFKRIEAAIKAGNVEIKNRKLYDALLDGAAEFSHGDSLVADDETTEHGPSHVS